MKTTFILTLILAFSVFTVGFSQELICDITVNIENVPSAQRDYLKNFESDLERYLNNNRWTTENLDGEKIHCTMTIFFKTVVGENRYQAQVFIGSQRPVYIGDDPSDKVTPLLRIFDEQWEFTYIPNQRMIHDDFTFEPLTDFFDFYAFLIIGFDLETYNELSGSRYFEKALNIWTQANGSGAKDWAQTSASYSRFGIVDELNNMKYQPFRLAFHSYHFDGVDLLETETVKGLEAILKAIESVHQVRQKQNPTSVLVKQFFDAKHLEIAEAFLQYPDRSIYDRLSAADQEHHITYQEYKEK